MTTHPLGTGHAPDAPTVPVAHPMRDPNPPSNLDEALAWAGCDETFVASLAVTDDARQAYELLDLPTQIYLLGVLKFYLGLYDAFPEAAQLVVEKIVNHAFGYVAAFAATFGFMGGDVWLVNGQHSHHSLTVTAEATVCSCDMYAQVGKYAVLAELPAGGRVCSHTIALSAVNSPI